MDRYFYPRTAAQMDALTEDQLASRIEYLTANGLTVSNVWTHNAPTPGIEFEASADPTALLQAWTPTPSAGRNKLLQARSIAFAFRDKVMVNPALFTENDRATAAAITLIERLARMD
jgi:hypothetical protein